MNLLINGIRLIILFDQSYPAYNNIFVIMVTLIMVAVASITVTKLMLIFNKESVDSIREGAEKQKETNHKMVTIADNVTNNFEETMNMIEKLKQCIEVNNFAMKNIAESTMNTA